MTSIVRFTTAEWKKRLEQRGGREDRIAQSNGAEIIIFPGVRVEYCDDEPEMRPVSRDSGDTGRRPGRLQLRPGARPTAE